MADIRINSLSTTAASTASDDFVAVDGSANGTRKLNAYSPTFGGNLTVGGSSTFSGTLNVTTGYGFQTTGWLLYQAGTQLYVRDTVNGAMALRFDPGASPSANVINALSVGGNLTVSGGTIDTAASTNLTLNGGSSGASLVLGQGTNGSPTLTPAGSGFTTIKGGSDASNALWITTPTFTALSAGTLLRTRFGATSGSTSVAIEALTAGGLTTGGSLSFASNGDVTAQAGSSGASLVLGQGTNGAITITPKGTGVATLAGNLTVSGTGNSSVAGTWLVGTTTNSSNGAVQLASHTTSAGGIGFGTDISLYREASSILTFSTSTHNYLKMLSSAADRQQGVLFNQSGNSAAIAFEGGSRGNYIGFVVNSAEGLQLTATSATFAGKVLTAAGTAAAPTLTFSGDSDTGFYTPGGNQVAATANGTQIWNTTSNGLAMASGKDIYVGNAYVAGAPTATGYIVIKDSTGTSYKIPAVAL